MLFFIRINVILLITIFLFISKVTPLFGPQDLIYNETEARILFDYVAAGHSPEPEGCFQNRFNKTSMPEVLERIETLCDVLTSKCYGIIARVPHKKQLVVVWKGTSSMTQFFFEGLALFIPDSYFYGLGGISYYFAVVFDYIWPYVEKYLKMEKYKDYDIIFSGHSLGSSMTVLCAIRTVQLGLRNSSQVKVMTFAEPRTGSLEFAKNFDSLIKYKFRVINGYDLLAHLPPCHKDFSFLPNKNLPCDTKSKSGSYHHMTEIWYYEGMTPGAKYQVCDGTQGEEHYCSDGVYLGFADIARGIADHRKYFGFMVSQYGKAGCDVDRTYDETEGFLGMIKGFMEFLNKIF